MRYKFQNYSKKNEESKALINTELEKVGLTIDTVTDEQYFNIIDSLFPSNKKEKKEMKKNDSSIIDKAFKNPESLTENDLKQLKDLSNKIHQSINQANQISYKKGLIEEINSLLKDLDVERLDAVRFFINSSNGKSIEDINDTVEQLNRK